MTDLPLTRVSVLDLTLHRAGPTCTRQLADWGAQVLKIEAPGGAKGDALGSDRTGFDYQNLHRNKRSMTLNLKSEDGREIFLKLAERADVVIESYRSDVKHRLGIDYETVSRINPRIVYGSISGFGQTGPDATRPGVDQIAQGHGRLDVNHRRARAGSDARGHPNRRSDRGDLSLTGGPSGAAAARGDRGRPMGAHIAAGSGDLHARFPGSALAHRAAKSRSRLATITRPRSRRAYFQPPTATLISRHPAMRFGNGSARRSTSRACYRIQSTRPTSCDRTIASHSTRGLPLSRVASRAPIG